MADRELSEHYPRRRGAPGEELLRVENLGRGGACRDVSFTLRRGEILGVAGLLGAGRTELARVLVGADRADSGRVLVEGREAARAARRGRHAPRHRPAARGPQDPGPGARPVRGAQPRAAQHAPPVAASAWSTQPARAGAGRRRRSTTCASRRRASGSRWCLLSGGNQQKVVLGKWLAAERGGAASWTSRRAASTWPRRSRSTS